MSEKSVASGGSRGSKASKASKASRVSKARERVEVPGDVAGIDETSKPSDPPTHAVRPDEAVARADADAEATSSAARSSLRPDAGTALTESDGPERANSRLRGTERSSESSENPKRPKENPKEKRTTPAGRGDASAKMKSVSPAVKAALGDLAADARAMAAIKAAQTEMRLLKEAEAMEAEIAAAQKRSGTLKDAFERSQDPETLLRELAVTRAHLDASDEKRRATERDLDLAGRAVREAERENDELKRRLTSRAERATPKTPKDDPPGAPSASTSPAPGANHEEIFELRRRISNLNAELQLAEIDKEKLRQLREAAEKRRGEAEARRADADVEVARSRAAITRLASLESDLHRALAAKEASEEKHRAEIRASTSEAEHLNAKLAAEVTYYKRQLDRKRDKKRQHKAHAYELATRLQEAVKIAKDTASDCERAIARAKAEAAQSVASAARETEEKMARDAASAALASASASALSEALEKKRGKKKAYKSQLERVEQSLTESRAETSRFRTAMVNARKLYETERAAAEASLARADAEHASSAERGQSRVRELEEALKRAARDYKKLERERVAVVASAATADDALGAVKRENARLASAASRLEDDAKRHKEAAARAERDLAAARAALRKAEEEFAQRLARDRRAWEQAAASRGEYVEFDPYARGDRDGRPKRPPKGGRDENESNRPEAPKKEEKGASAREGDPPTGGDATAREMRPAGMSSAHLERVAMREKNKYAQRQRDLAMGVRAEYLVD